MTAARTLIAKQLQNRVRDQIKVLDEQWQGIIGSSPKSAPLTDTFNRKHTYLRISITEKCNLRCTYCMPEEGVQLSPHNQLLTASEIIKLSSLFVRAGVQKIRLTGGEPTVRSDLVDILAGLNALRPLGLKTIGMTTNGIALKRKLPALRENGLDQINISLDTMDPFKFQLLTRRKGLENVLDCIKLASNMDFDSVKVNTVVMKKVNDDELGDFVKMTRELPIYVRFIEYMPFDGNKWNHSKFVAYRTMLKDIEREYPDTIKVDDSKNDTSKAYSLPGYKGKFGFITSMSEHFCHTCNRLRITANGQMKVCLFGNAEVNLRDALRKGCSDEELLEMIGGAVERKKEKHAAGPYQVPLRNAFGLHRQSPAGLFLRQSSMFFSTSANNQPNTTKLLSHVDEATGKASMVHVGDKIPTKRTAIASAIVKFSTKESFSLLQQNAIKKGDVLTVAQIAGIQACKLTPQLIPLCHPIPINHIKIAFELQQESHSVLITTSVETALANTGVEVEAMVGCSVAAVTIFDMCKAVDKRVEIGPIRLLEKTGGKSGPFSACEK